MCKHICTYIYIYVHIFVQIECIYTNIFIYIYIYMKMYLYVNYIYVYVYMFICIYVRVSFNTYCSPSPFHRGCWDRPYSGSFGRRQVPSQQIVFTRKPATFLLESGFKTTHFSETHAFPMDPQQKTSNADYGFGLVARTCPPPPA